MTFALSRTLRSDGVSETGKVATFNSERDLEDFLNTATITGSFIINAKGGKFTLSEVAGELISGEAQAVLDRMTGLTSVERNAIINFVNQEVAVGNYAKYDEFYCFSLSGANALTGFKSKTAINNGATFGVEGAEFDGTTYIDTAFAPATDAVNMTNEEFSWSYFISKYSPSNPALTDLFGVRPADANQRITFRNLGYWYTDVLGNNVAETTYKGPWQNSLHAVSKNSGVGGTMYIDGVEIRTGNVPPAPALPNDFIFAGKYNVGGSTGFIGAASTLLIGGLLPSQEAHYQNLLQFLIDLDTFAKPVIDSFPQPLAAGEEDRIRAFINAEVLAGNWGKYDSFADFTLTDSANALWDWINKSSFVNNGAVKGVNGFTFDGFSQYIDTVHVLGSGLNYNLNNGVFEIFYSSAPAQGISGVRINGTNTETTTIGQGPSNTSGSINSGSGGSSARRIQNNDLVSIARDSATNLQHYFNGALNRNQVVGSNTLVSASIYVGARNQEGLAGSYQSGTMSTFLVGGNLPNYLTHYNNIRALLGL